MRHDLWRRLIQQAFQNHHAAKQIARSLRADSPIRSAAIVGVALTAAGCGTMPRRDLSVSERESPAVPTVVKRHSEKLSRSDDESVDALEPPDVILTAGETVRPEAPEDPTLLAQADT